VTTTKSPAYQWYPRDFLADVLTLEDGEELLYRRLLDYQWLHHEVPSSWSRMGKAARMTAAKVKAYWPAISSHFPDKGPGGGWQNRRIERERAKQEAYRAKQRDNGTRGGRPALRLDKSA